MFPWSLSRRACAELPPGLFTPEQATHLTALKTRFQTYPDGFKLDVSLYRVLFARWLVERGILGEGAHYGRLLERAAPDWVLPGTEEDVHAECRTSLARTSETRRLPGHSA